MTGLDGRYCSSQISTVEKLKSAIMNVFVRHSLQNGRNAPFVAGMVFFMEKNIIVMIMNSIYVFFNSDYFRS